MSQRDGHSFTFLSLFLLLLSQYRAAALHYAMESSLFVSFGSAPSGTRDAGQDAPPLSCCYDPRLLFLPSLSSPAPSPRLSRSSHTKQGRLPLTLDPRVDSQQCLSQGQQKERRRQMRLATCTSRHSPSPPLLSPSSLLSLSSLGLATSSPPFAVRALLQLSFLSSLAFLARPLALLLPRSPPQLTLPSPSRSSLRHGRRSRRCAADERGRRAGLRARLCRKVRGGGGPGLAAIAGLSLKGRRPSGASAQQQCRPWEKQREGLRAALH